MSDKTSAPTKTPSSTSQPQKKFDEDEQDEKSKQKKKRDKRGDQICEKCNKQFYCLKSSYALCNDCEPHDDSSDVDDD